MSLNLNRLVVDSDWGAAERLKAGKALNAADAVGAKQMARRLAGRLIAGARS
ncbi:MAG TPA: hypothetical protein VGY52_14135 [Roseiarcus sp.]|jgi:hypothetical protein|nr:hypothetical protein [Roseiarcus sp.]